MLSGGGANGGLEEDREGECVALSIRGRTVLLTRVGLFKNSAELEPKMDVSEGR